MLLSRHRRSGAAFPLLFLGGGAFFPLPSWVVLFFSVVRSCHLLSGAVVPSSPLLLGSGAASASVWVVVLLLLSFTFLYYTSSLLPSLGW